MRNVYAVVVALLLLTTPLSAQVRPDATRTPGATNPAITAATTATTLCSKTWSTKSIRPPASYTTSLKKTQMAAMGYTVPNPLPRVKTKSGKGTRPDLTKCVARSANPACFELDHLISLELGGAPRDPKNLWPQPWTGQWNARDKDRLENELHARVCRGTLSLAAAQQAIATDWVAAYQRYVGATPSGK